MKRRYWIPAVIVVVGVIGFVNVRNWSSPKIEFVTVAKAWQMQGGSESLASLESSIASCLKDCPPADRDMALRFQEAIPLIRAGETYKAIEMLSTVILDAMTDSRFSSEAKLQLSSVAIMNHQALGDNASKEDTDRLRQVFLEWIKSDPKNAAALGQRAFMLSRTGAPAEDVIQAYVDCLQVDPENQFCRSNYQSEYANYAKPTCLPGRLSHDLKFYEIQEKAKKDFQVKMNLDDGQIVYRAQQPSLTGDDFEKVDLVADEYQKPIVGLTTTESGKQKLAAVTAANKGKKLVVIVDDSVISSPLISEEIKSGAVWLDLGISDWAEVERIKNRMCVLSEARELPQDLQINQ